MENDVKTPPAGHDAAGDDGLEAPAAPAPGAASPELLQESEVARYDAEDAAVTSPEAAGEAEARANDYEDRWLRLAADFENFRRRVAREREQAAEQGAERALLTVIRVLDDLERAQEAAAAENATVEALREGLALVVSHARQALADSGVEIVDPQGAVFDPASQEAVMRDPGGEPNTVTRVLARGYTRGGRVLRAAQVVVGG